MCAGIDITQPQVEYKYDKVVFKTYMKSSFINIDSFCEGSLSELNLNETNPKAIHRNPENTIRLESALLNASDPHFYHWIAPIWQDFDGKHFFWNTQMHSNVLAPLIHWVTSHVGYRQWCSKNHQ